MNKKYLHHLKSTLRPVRTWYILAAFLIVACCAGFELLHNNLRMAELRNNVYTADQENGDVEGALQELRSFVTSHMNTKLSSGEAAVYPPIQLKYTYERLQQSEQDRIRQENNNVYTEAQKHCEALYPDSFSGGPRVPCIVEYVDQHGIKVNKIPDALYKFDFVSPSWSPDLAGWLAALAAVLFVATLLRWLLGKFLPS